MWGLIGKVMLGLLIGGAATAAVVGVVGIAGVIYDRIHQRIGIKEISEHFEQKIKEKYNSGDYVIADVGLNTRAEIIDISNSEGDTYVAYEVNGERYGLRSSCGTSVQKGDVIALS